MKSAIKPVGISAVLLTLAGCADFQLPQLPQLPTLPTPPSTQTTPAVIKEIPVITDTVKTICDTTKDNELRANELYKNKKLSTLAAFSSLREHEHFRERKRTPNYELSFSLKWDKYKDAAISAETKDRSNKQMVLSLSKNKNYQVSGTVLSIDTMGSMCIIRIFDAEISASK